jgi:hypothetical protein
MKSDDREILVEEKVRGELDVAAAGLDAGLVGRLRQARLRALAGAEPGKRRPFFLPPVPRWVTAGGFAATAVVVIAVSFWAASVRSPLPVRQPEDLEILTSQEHLDLYADLEFYRWLAADEEQH